MPYLEEPVPVFKDEGSSVADSQRKHTGAYSWLILFAYDYWNPASQAWSQVVFDTTWQKMLRSKYLT